MEVRRIEDIFRRWGVRLAYLFGSVAEGRADSQSDVDVGVVLPEPCDGKAALSQVAHMQQDLRPFFDRKLDLVVLNLAGPLLAHEVIRRGQVLYSHDESERMRYEVRIRDTYEDYRHIQSFFIRALKEQLAS
ncbi:MAG: nucleotidyltransferase domain-containing protein [Armatimonadetes bacterium]|nr:nucleotidyltransferase domain-containing protein [Armatimonadota bacterium]